MMRSFHSDGSEDIFNRINSREARHTCPEKLWAIARRKLEQLNAVVSLESLRIPPGNRRKHCMETEPDNTVSASMTNTESALFGAKKGRKPWKSLIT